MHSALATSGPITGAAMGIAAGSIDRYSGLEYKALFLKQASKTYFSTGSLNSKPNG